MALAIDTGKHVLPYRAVIYGPEGVGKTSLAALFPKALFLDTEGSTIRYNLSRIKVKNWPHLLEICDDLAKDAAGFKTIVIDTADWAQQLAADYILAIHKRPSLGDWDYGKGYDLLQVAWKLLIDKLSALHGKGLNVILNCHAQMRNCTLPEETKSFDRWELKLYKSSSNKTDLCAMSKEWADMVLFLKYQLVLFTDEKSKKTKAEGGAKRELITTHSAAWDAKNRDSLPDSISVQEGVLPPELAALFKDQPAPVKTTTEAKTEPKSEPAKAPDCKACNDSGINSKGGVCVCQEKEKNDPLPPPVTAPGGTEDRTAFDPALWNLMTLQAITREQVKDYYVKKGFFPASVEPEDLPAEFVQKLVKNWDKVVTAIKGAK
jgi:hypothetical protein